MTEETKKKLSEAKKGKMAGKNHWNYGNHWSEEVKQKISSKHKGYKMAEETKEKLRKNLVGATTLCIILKCQKNIKRNCKKLV